MKIGILTYHCVPNFGAQLQTLSTVCYLRGHGHEPIVLHWYPYDLEKMYGARRIPREQYMCHEQFAKKYFPLSRLCRVENDLIQEIESNQLDAILLGSDAMFKYIPISKRWYVTMGKYLPKIIRTPAPSVEQLHGNPFLGDFISRVKHRIPVSTYAVSSQNCPYTDMNYFERRFLKRSLNNYTEISVRDDWTKDMVEHLTGRQNISIYPDPVFAFNYNCADLIPQREKILKKYNLPDNYMLLCFNLHFCSKEYVESIAEQVKAHGYQPIELTTPEGRGIIDSARAIRSPLSPLDWFAIIKYSRGYIGELMHAIVTCLHNAVPFFSFDIYGVPKNKGLYSKDLPYDPRSSKIYHILSKAELLEYWYPFLGTSKIPDPENVVNLIVKFDSNKCEQFAMNQYAEYEIGMAAIMKTLQNNL